jgi:hypothetical protein
MKNVYPGINRSVRKEHFDSDEKHILEFLAKDWYVTNGGAKITINDNSHYKYFLMEPARDYQEMFNLEKEVIVLFSPYETFESRSITVFDEVYKRYPDIRLENVCCILVSKDNNIKERVQQLVLGDPESRVIIPFSYKEFQESTNTYFLKNRFRSFFFERDLFSFSSPITKDLFFYGRTNLIQKITNRHKTNENSGLFGLRKTGKTSVINGIARALKFDNTPSVIIDCQDTSFNQRRWNEGLYYLIKEIKRQNEIKCKTAEEIKYTLANANSIFEKDLKRIFIKTNKQPILIIFDEIENISPNTSPNPNWKDGIDFVLFWQSLRSSFQKFIREEENPIFTFLIVGTNPKAIETTRINNTDNPIFNKIPFEYIQGFNVNQTTEMISNLGGYMGLEFEDTVFAKLKDDFGGHPFLMRHVCSIANEFAIKNRPAKIDKIQYENAKKIFIERYNHYFEMILDVLVSFYPEEYDMLTYLANEDMDVFNELSNLSPELTAHLKGYNLIDENDGNYYFKIESIKEYLRNKNKYKAKLKTPEERWKEISERRNKLEVKLRQLVRMQMQSNFGKTEAFNKVINIYGSDRKNKHTGCEYIDLFNPIIVNVYFIDLQKIIIKYYDDVFKNIFGSNKDEIKVALDTINKYRSDAHAKNIEVEEMDFFRVNISKIEKLVYDFI